VAQCARRQSDALRETRKLSMVIQLSEPLYTGGTLDLENDPLPPGVFARKGSAIFFPSFNWHRVTPVTAGVRYSLVCWFMGPPFR
jgi:PKHD-type hydroxylase